MNDFLQVKNICLGKHNKKSMSHYRAKNRLIGYGCSSAIPDGQGKTGTAYCFQI